MLLDVIKGVEKLYSKLLFILETNGIEIGRDESYAEDLSNFGNLHVRIFFKTGNSKNFELITSRPKDWFELQIRAFENLYGKVSFHPALVVDYTDEYLLKRLKSISPEIRLENEKLVIYSHMKRRMKERGLL